MFLKLDQRSDDSVIGVDAQGGSLTAEAFRAEAARLDGLLEKRSVMFLLCNNTAGALAIYLGAVCADVVPVMLSANINETLLRSLYETYRPRYLSLPEQTELPLEDSMESVYAARGYRILRTENPVYPIHEDVELLMTTSGSTGSPKLVKYRRGNLEVNAKNVAIAFGWTAAERPLCDLAMNYTMGLNVINTHIYAGASVYLCNLNMMSAEYWDFLRDNRLTNLTQVPFGYDLMLKLRFTRMDLPDLKTFSEGGGKLSDEKFRLLAEFARDSGKRFIASFGTTETSARLAMLPPEMALTKTGSIGRAIPEGRLALLDENGQEITAPDMEGELVYSGPNVTMGYAVCMEDLRKGDEFRGTYRTGDLAKRDSEGYYYITGRKSRFVKLLGYRVSLDQCENLVKDHFRTECACVGRDELVKVYITDEKLINEVSVYLPRVTGYYKSLFQVTATPSIPKSDSGKTLYAQLPV